MGDQLEARISAIECIQEEFEHDIREIKEQLARLTKLVEDRAEARVVQPRSSSPQNFRPCFPVANNVSNRAYYPNLCPSMHAPMTTPAGVRMSWPVNQSSSLREQPKEQKISKDRTRLDLIPLSYTELFPKLLEKGLIKPIRLPLLRSPFPKWYKADARCDYHAGNPGHSLENCTALKYKVQELIQDGKVKFDEQDKVRHSFPIFSRIKEDVSKGSREDKIKGKDVGCSLTNLKLEKQSLEVVGAKFELREGKEDCSHEKKKTHLEEGKKEYVTALRGEHDRQIMD